MQDHPVLETDRLTGRNRVIARRLLPEVVPSERVSGEEPVGPDVPGRGIAEALGVVQDRDPDGLARDRRRNLGASACERRTTPGTGRRNRSELQESVGLIGSHSERSRSQHGGTSFGGRTVANVLSTGRRGRNTTKRLDLPHSLSNAQEFLR